MGFAELNDRIAANKKAQNSEYITLKKTTDTPLDGKLVDVKVRDKIWKDKPVQSSKTGEIRKEWVFTIETKDGVKKWTANEAGQWAVQGALNEDQKLKEGGRLQVRVVEDPPDTTSQATYKAFYSDPVTEFPVPDSDEPPY